jgi:phosphoenolpyruvate carboxykinase (ATP)
MPIHVTRALLRAALDGSLARATFRRDPFFGFATPTDVPGVDPKLLDPAATWSCPKRYADTASRLVGMFRDSFEAFAPFVDQDVREAGPGAP